MQVLGCPGLKTSSCFKIFRTASDWSSAAINLAIQLLNFLSSVVRQPSEERWEAEQHKAAQRCRKKKIFAWTEADLLFILGNGLETVLVSTRPVEVCNAREAASPRDHYSGSGSRITAKYCPTSNDQKGENGIQNSAAMGGCAYIIMKVTTETAILSST
ncbi:hypothetical protein TPS_00583 [Trichinella pseudospiralis]